MTIIKYFIDWLLSKLLPDSSETIPISATTPKVTPHYEVYVAEDLPAAEVTAIRLPTKDQIRTAVSRVHGGLNSIQSTRLNIIIFYIRKYEISDLRQVAYILQTAYHESQGLMELKERRARRGTSLRALQNRYWHTGYWGRGFIQVTWEANYKKLSELLKLNLVNNPDHLLDEHVAAEALVRGMQLGIYTYRRLSDYFNDYHTDWRNARRIVNGLDRSRAIAEDAKAIYEELKAYEDADQV